MTKRLLAILLLCASPAAAQIGVPSTAPGSSTPSSTITNGVTDTSGCVAGGVLRSISNLVDCGAGFTYASGVAGIGTASATSGSLRIFNSAHAFYTEFTIGVQAGNLAYVLPTSLGSAGEVLTDVAGNGTLSWETPAAGSVTTAALEDATYGGASAVGTDAYAVTLTTAPASLAAMEGVVVSFKADVGNTGAATIAFNGFAATAITNNDAALVTGDISVGSVVVVEYNGVAFQCLTCYGNGANLTTSNTWTATNQFSVALYQFGAVEAVTATKTTTAAESNETYTNTGDLSLIHI